MFLQAMLGGARDKVEAGGDPGLPCDASTTEEVAWPRMGGMSRQHLVSILVVLFAQGAEGISVNGLRITPLSAFSGTAGQVIIDQGPPISSPLKVLAVGDRVRMEAALNDPSAVPAIRAREVQFQLQLTFRRGPDMKLPAYDSSL
ncbi:MAG TPA: DUF881 domain-containing protein [Candidatus Dormibacteraeota bacterium]|nr:DUF881 domain-containing protein [Candidatus Dormibacteraeota bacterium]